MGGNNGQQETAGTVKEEVTGRNRQTSKNIERRIYEKKKVRNKLLCRFIARLNL